ncbi:MAG: gamma-glutamyl-gamma-aminobutyrate hydrolase family protein [Verrucomicrobiales bacterium]|nr:gamma-glutamyl-gamma-aminobutyrate hydrolase family protein [Verrucomicrobiales bacterium]
MKQAPLILITPSTDRKGVEFHDYSLSLSDAYPRAIQMAGGIPWVMSGTPTREVIAESVRRSDGVLLTGGDDVQTGLYAPNLPPKLKKTVLQADPARDWAELAVIEEVFRQQKALLAICRGQQILNVAFGGDLIVDIPSQLPRALRHKRFDMKSREVHEVTLAPDSLLAELFGTRQIGVNSTHHQAVGRVAKPFRVTAQSADGIIEALELNLAERHLLPYLLAVQFHPERLLERRPQFPALFRSFIEASASRSKRLV